MKRSFTAIVLAGVIAMVCAPTVPLRAQAVANGGWVCGLVTLENGGIAVEPQLRLVPPDQLDAEPVAQMAAGPRGQFCFKDVPPGFYDLLAGQPGWPRQPPRRVEVRSGLINRLTTSIEVQFEPNDPSVRYEESFDGMSPTDARFFLRQLVTKADRTSLEEAARRLLPKRSVAIDVNNLSQGFDPKPLVQELMRQLENNLLPPIKTARYVYLIGELGDPRLEDVIVPFLLQKLSDGRALPQAFTLAEKPTYVSDYVIQEVVRYSGRDFKWKYGESPIRNQSAVRRAREWWRNELAKKSENR